MADYNGAPVTYGAHLCTIAQVRAADRALADTAKYPDAKITEAIETAEQTIEQAAHVAFIPHERTYTTLGSGTARLLLPDNAIRAVTSVMVGGVALTEAELAALVVREWGAIDRSVIWTADAAIVVTYQHGLDTPPGPIMKSCIILAVEELIPSAIPARATATTVGDQMYRITVAGRDGETGIPYVDTAIARFGRKRPAMA